MRHGRLHGPARIPRAPEEMGRIIGSQTSACRQSEKRKRSVRVFSSCRGRVYYQPRPTQIFGAGAPMSRSAIPPTDRPAAIPGALSDGLHAASPRQVARLRFLGVRFQESLSMGQAGTLINRANADPAYAAKISEWHAQQIRAVPAALSERRGGRHCAGPPGGRREVSPAAARRYRTECDHLPETPARTVRRMRLPLDRLIGARAGGCPDRFPGRGSSGALAGISERAGRGAGAGTAARGCSRPTLLRSLVQRRVLSLGCRSADDRGCHRGGPVYFHQPTAAPTAAAPAASIPAAVAAGAPDPAALASARSREAVAASKSRALQKYPALGVAGSRFNTAFVARYQQLSQRDSTRLKSADWPEQVAADCAAKLPRAAYSR